MEYLGQFTVDESATAYITMLSGATGQTGKTLTITLVKNGGSTLAASGIVSSEVGSGVYKLQFKSPDTNSLGLNLVYITAAGCDATYATFQVVPVGVLDPVLAIDNALSNAGLKHLSEEVRRLAARVQTGRWKPKYGE